VLHVAPEAMDGGPLGIVQDGDMIQLDCHNGLLNVELPDAEIVRRLAERAEKNKPVQHSGYQRLYLDHVMQADDGCDFDFLVGCRGSAVPKHSH
jgi:L-arabonate dehydrase